MCTHICTHTHTHAHTHLQNIHPQVALHEEELRALKHEEASRASILADLSSQRDRVTLSIAQKLAKVG